MKCSLKGNRTHRGQRSRKGWKTVAHAAALSVIGTGATARSLAQAAADTGSRNLADPGLGETSSSAAGQQASPERSAEALRQFDIPAGELVPALERYGQLTGIKMHPGFSADKLAGFRTGGVHGLLSDTQALHLLLDKTGLEGQFEGPNKVEIAIRNAERVEVTASAAQVGLQQFPQALLDTAQTVNVVPQYIMSEQADTTLRDTLRNVPGISIAAGEGGAQGDSLTIRGFNARNDIFLDGIRDFGSYYRDSFDYQSVDVLEGPASVEFGRGSTGGVVNQESKVPELHPFANSNVQFGSDAMRRGSLDFDRPIEAIPGGTAVRFNAAGEDTNIAGRDVTETRRFGVAPSIAFGLNTKTRLTVSYLREYEDSIPDYGLPYFGATVAPVPHNTYYGLSAANYLRTTPDVITAKADHDFGLHVTMRNTFRWGNYARDFRITEPQVNSAAAVVYTNPDKKNAYENASTGIAVQCAITATPSTSCFPFNTPLNQIYVNRNEIAGHSTEDILWDQISTSGHFNLGHIANNAVVLVEGGRERSNPNRPAYLLPYVSLLNPNPSDSFAPTTTYPGATTHVASQSFGIDFLDTLELTHWLEISGGVRFDYFSTQSYAPANLLAKTPVPLPVTAERLDKQPTYRAAVVVKPRPAGSVYFDWGTSFNPAAESLSLSGNNATSPPEYNQTFEVGAKWNYLHDRLNLNGSVFRTEKLNARETDPNNSANVLNAGNQLVRGIQVGALGHLPSSFDLIVGYAVLDGRVESSKLNASPYTAVNAAFYSAWQTALKTNPAATVDPRFNTAPFYINPAGLPLANVPRNSGNVWVTHKLLYKFTGGFGGSYVGARRASSAAAVGVYDTQSILNPASVAFAYKSVPGYTLLNAMLQRSINDHISLQANVANLANKFFIDQPHPGHLVPGEGINAQFGLNYKF